MKSFYSAIHRHLSSGVSLVLVTIISQEGSTPRTAGARMIVLPDGAIEGTVGGGRYEAEAIAAALTLPGRPAGSGDGRPGLLLRCSLRGVSDMDMICGGELILLLEHLPADLPTTALFAAAREAEERGNALAFVSRIDRLPPGSGVPASSAFGKNAAEGDLFDHARQEAALSVSVRRFVPLEAFSGNVWRPSSASLTESPPETVLRRVAKLAGGAAERLRCDGTDYLLEHLPRPHRAHLFGGGHVSRELAILARRLDLAVTVLDDRPEFAAPERFPGCAVHMPPSLGLADARAYFEGREIGERDAIVIVTRGHAHDRDVLEAALGTRAGYIGMIGSRSKRAAVYAALAEKGWTSADLERVRSPIGLPILAETPEEIAVSIAAELILWRRGGTGALRQISVSF